MVILKMHFLWSPVVHMIHYKIGNILKMLQYVENIVTIGHRPWAYQNSNSAISDDFK